MSRSRWLESMPVWGLVVVLVLAVALPAEAGRVAGTDDEDDVGRAGLAKAPVGRGGGSAAVLNSAKSLVGLVSKNVPGTNGGRLACAWAVTKILEKAGLMPKGSAPKNLSVLNLVANLKKRGWKEFANHSVSSMRPGDVIVWQPPRHVGVYAGNGKAISNSSSQGRVRIHPVKYSSARVVKILRAPA